MTASFFMRRTSAGYLAPDDDRAMRALVRIPRDSVVRVEVKAGRSVPMMRKFWAMIHKVHENQTAYATPELLEKALCVYLGHYDVLYMRDGTEVRVPRSIAFDKLSQAEFNELYDRALRLVQEHIIPGLPEGALRAELEAFAA